MYSMLLIYYYYYINNATFMYIKIKKDKNYEQSGRDRRLDIAD